MKCFVIVSNKLLLNKLMSLCFPVDSGAMGIVLPSGKWDLALWWVGVLLTLLSWEYRWQWELSENCLQCHPPEDCEEGGSA